MTRKTLKTYDVTYLVTVAMTYRIKAANPEQAEELAEQDGELIGRYRPRDRLQALRNQTRLTA